MTPTHKALTPAGEYEKYRKKVLHWWENEQLLNHLKLIIKHRIGHTLLSYNEIEKIYQLEHENIHKTEGK